MTRADTLEAMPDTATAVDERAIRELLVNYRPSDETIATLRGTPIILLAGPSGAGKDTIISGVLGAYPGEVQQIISATTRKPRSNDGRQEQHGVHYHFLTLDEAAAKLRNGEYVEAAIYNGNVYGQLAGDYRAAHEAHRAVINDIEVQGVANLVSLSDTVRPVFIVPSSYEEWLARLVRRYGEPELSSASLQDLSGRLETALDEIDIALAADYYIYVVNDQLESAVRTVGGIIHGQLPSDDEQSAARDRLRQIRAELRVRFGR